MIRDRSGNQRVFSDTRSRTQDAESCSNGNSELDDKNRWFEEPSHDRELSWQRNPDEDRMRRRCQASGAVAGGGSSDCFSTVRILPYHSESETGPGSLDICRVVEPRGHFDHGRPRSSDRLGPGCVAGAETRPEPDVRLNAGPRSRHLGPLPIPARAARWTVEIDPGVTRRLRGFLEFADCHPGEFAAHSRSGHAGP